MAETAVSWLDAWDSHSLRQLQLSKRQPDDVILLVVVSSRASAVSGLMHCGASRDVSLS